MKPNLRISTTQLPNPFDSNPDYEDLVTFTCHKHYVWGNDCRSLEMLEKDFTDEENNFNESELHKMIRSLRDGDPFLYKDNWYYPVFVLDHSGLTYSRTPFNDYFDSGLGFIIKADKDFKSKWQNLVDEMNNFESGYAYLVQEIDLETGDCINCFEIDELNFNDIDELMKQLGCSLQNEYTKYEYEYAAHNCKLY